MKIPTLRIRLYSLLIDWLVISVYLVLLSIVATMMYVQFLEKIPNFNHLQSQLVATLSSVIPILLTFTYLEGRAPYGSIGKRKVGLVVHYQHQPMRRSLVRNIIKFLPWQIGHIGTISGVYSHYTSLLSQVATVVSLSLVLLYCSIVFIRKDGRGPHDLVAGSIVICQSRTS